MTSETPPKPKYSSIQEQLYQNMTPLGYHNPLGRFAEAVFLDRKNKNRDRFFPANKYDQQWGHLAGREHLRNDAWAKFLGQPQPTDTIVKSKYKPSKSKDKDAEYFDIRDDAWRDKIVDQAINVVMGSTDAFQAHDSIVMGDFQFSHGEDEKGRYIAYYDKWDLARGGNMFGEPFEIYGRIYQDEIAKRLPNSGYVWSDPSESSGKKFNKARELRMKIEENPEEFFKDFGKNVDSFNEIVKKERHVPAWIRGAQGELTVGTQKHGGMIRRKYQGGGFTDPMDFLSALTSGNMFAGLQPDFDFSIDQTIDASDQYDDLYDYYRSKEKGLFGKKKRARRKANARIEEIENDPLYRQNVFRERRMNKIGEYFGSDVFKSGMTGIMDQFQDYKQNMESERPGIEIDAYTVNPNQGFNLSFQDGGSVGPQPNMFAKMMTYGAPPGFGVGAGLANFGPWFAQSMYHTGKNIFKPTESPGKKIKGQDYSYTPSAMDLNQYILNRMYANSPIEEPIEDHLKDLKENHKTWAKKNLIKYQDGGPLEGMNALGRAAHIPGPFQIPATIANAGVYSGRKIGQSLLDFVMSDEPTGYTYPVKKVKYTGTKNENREEYTEKIPITTGMLRAYRINKQHGTQVFPKEILPYLEKADKAYKKQDGGEIKTSKLGYRTGSPDENELALRIPGNRISMDNVEKDLILVPDVGEPIMVKANSGVYDFPGATEVIEYPVDQLEKAMAKKMKKGGKVRSFQEGGPFGSTPSSLERYFYVSEGTPMDTARIDALYNDHLNTGLYNDKGSVARYNYLGYADEGSRRDEKIYGKAKDYNSFSKIVNNESKYPEFIDGLYKKYQASNIFELKKKIPRGDRDQIVKDFQTYSQQRYDDAVNMQQALGNVEEYINRKYQEGGFTPSEYVPGVQSSGQKRRRYPTSMLSPTALDMLGPGTTAGFNVPDMMNPYAIVGPRNVDLEQYKRDLINSRKIDEVTPIETPTYAQHIADRAVSVPTPIPTRPNQAFAAANPNKYRPVDVTVPTAVTGNIVSYASQVGDEFSYRKKDGKWQFTSPKHDGWVTAKGEGLKAIKMRYEPDLMTAEEKAKAPPVAVVTPAQNEKHRFGPAQAIITSPPTNPGAPPPGVFQRMLDAGTPMYNQADNTPSGYYAMQNMSGPSQSFQYRATDDETNTATHAAPTYPDDPIDMMIQAGYLGASIIPVGKGIQLAGRAAMAIPAVRAWRAGRAASRARKAGKFMKYDQFFEQPRTGGRFSKPVYEVSPGKFKEIGGSGKFVKRPDNFQMGGPVEPVPVQLEKGEEIIFEDGSIVKPKANKRHSQMSDYEYTDYLPEGTYIASRDDSQKIDRDVANNMVVMSGDPMLYEENNATPIRPDKTLGDMFRKKKETPAAIARRIRSKFPVTDNDDIFGTVTGAMNLQSRIPYNDALIRVAEGQRTRGESDQYKYGGWTKPQQYPVGGIISGVGQIFGAIAQSAIAKQNEKRIQQNKAETLADVDTFEQQSMADADLGLNIGGLSAIGQAAATDTSYDYLNLDPLRTRTQNALTTAGQNIGVQNARADRIQMAPLNTMARNMSYMDPRQAGNQYRATYGQYLRGTNERYLNTLDRESDLALTGAESLNMIDKELALDRQRGNMYRRGATNLVNTSTIKALADTGQNYISNRSLIRGSALGARMGARNQATNAINNLRFTYGDSLSRMFSGMGDLYDGTQSMGRAGEIGIDSPYTDPNYQFGQGQPYHNKKFNIITGEWE